ncbi:MAG TPA: DNA-binding protein [Eubacteriales bacterium]|nr:DNA-binding protein [Eubacteriales bacterium]
MEHETERLVEFGQLLDRYGVLLTERQMSISAQYAYENCSLAEIAEREGISRQGVRDMLVRSELQLRQFENKLSMVKKLKKQEKLLGEIDSCAHKLVEGSGERVLILQSLEELQSIWEDENGI